jgi:hypothetical protein
MKNNKDTNSGNLAASPGETSLKMIHSAHAIKESPKHLEAYQEKKNEPVVRRYSFDDNGGGYSGL